MFDRLRETIRGDLFTRQQKDYSIHPRTIHGEEYQWRSVLSSRLDLSSDRFFWRAGQPNESFSRLKRKYEGREGGNRSFKRSLTFVLTTEFAHQFSTCPFVVFFQRKRNERETWKICKKFLRRRIRYRGEVTRLTISIRIFSDLIQHIFIIKYVYKLALNPWILKI